MGTNESGYQCSECGAKVSADDNVCPNCGISLEDISEDEISNEEEFVEIPVTSNPADLSSILSLLDENKIEYSIYDDAMENIWGPNFIQLPKLLVHKEQVEEVKEIISGIQDQVEVIDTEVFAKQSSENEARLEPIKGVEGWLLFFCMILIFSPIAYIPYNINYYIEMQDELTWITFIDWFFIIDLVLSILISCLSIYAGLKLWRIRPDALKTTNVYLNVFLVYSLIIFLTITIIFSNFKIPFNTEIKFLYGQMIRETISSITFVVVLKLYLKNSERVKNTFGMRFSPTIPY